MELAFIGTGVESMFPKSLEDFPYMTPMVFRVVGVNEDIVEVNDYQDVEKVLKDVVHETLESGGSVRKSEGHYEPFEGSVFCAERGFPLVAFRDADQMVSVSEVNFCIDTSFTGTVEEIGNERKRIAILFRDSVQGSEIDAESKGSVFLLDK